MKKLIVSLIFALAVPLTVAQAAPFLVCNPEGVTLASGQTLTYNVTGLPASIAATNIVADSTGTYGFALDLATLPAGSYTVTATACLNDPVQGVSCTSASSPFSFSRIGPPPVPAGLGLSVKP
jgi:hypothetical protein